MLTIFFSLSEGSCTGFDVSGTRGIVGACGFGGGGSGAGVAGGGCGRGVLGRMYAREVGSSDLGQSVL